MPTELELANLRIADLENQLLRIHDGYAHLLREQREAFVGAVGEDSRLRRFLRTCLAAAERRIESLPELVTQRLEDSLKILDDAIRRAEV